MDYQIKLLAIVVVINILFSLFVVRQEKNKINILFAFFTLFIGLWSLGLGVFIHTTDLTVALLASNFFYLAPPLIVTTFYLFSMVFVENEINRRHFLHYLPFIGLLCFFVFEPKLILEKIYITDYGIHKDVVINKLNYIIYVIYVVSYIIASYSVLFRSRTLQLLPERKRQLNAIIIGTLVSYILATFFNLLLPYLGNYQLISYGPLFTLVMVFSIAYAIFKYNLFNIKLILVELALLILNVFLFINVFTSQGRVDLILNVSVSISIFIFTIFLLRGIYKDIRDRERIRGLVQEVAIANERLYAMEQQKTEFVSIASHQLRTPLTVIKGYASMILDGTFGALNEGTSDAIEKLYKSSERIVALVEDLLTVSRIEQGRVMLNLETINFKDFIQKVVNETKEEAIAAKVDISFSVEYDRELYVSVDEKKFRQAVYHILENAVKYTPEFGSVNVSIAADNIVNKARLIVSDTGVGMTQEQVNTIFEQFNLKANLPNQPLDEQITGDTEILKESDTEVVSSEGASTKQRSPGIGLYIAQEIIDAHRGTISIKSPGLNKGVTVFVEIPSVPKQD